MKRDIDAEMSLYCVQKPEDEEVLEKAMVELYNRMFEKYFEEKKLIPEGHLVEVKYEDFITNPLREIKRIYQELGLPNFEDSEDEFKQYILSQSKIRTHRYSIDEELKKKIYSYFKLTINRWGYDVWKNFLLKKRSLSIILKCGRRDLNPGYKLGKLKW